MDIPEQDNLPTTPLSNESFKAKEAHDWTQPNFHCQKVFDAASRYVRAFPDAFEWGNMAESTSCTNIAGPDDFLLDSPLACISKAQSSAPLGDQTDQYVKREAVGADLPGSDGTEGEDADNVVGIGIALSNGRYMCIKNTCSKTTYGRPSELRRHYDTTHADCKPTFWCEIPSCERSAEAAGRPFHRKDKLLDHTRAMHEGGD